MTDVLSIAPVKRPIRGEIRLPGSKSLSNRALLIAALAEGRSTLTGLLDSRDTAVMLESLMRLGVRVHHDAARGTAVIDGCRGRFPAEQADLYLENSGTSIRFLTAACALSGGMYRLDGNERMRARPIGDLVAALRQLGADVRHEQTDGCPPVVVDAHGLRGGEAHVAGNVSSQFLSALLMVAPYAQRSVTLSVDGPLVSHPYIAMTIAVMRTFGVTVDREGDSQFLIEPDMYRGTAYEIEPDASAASYFFAAAAVTGGTVTVDGLSADAVQGDVAFVKLLEQMGCEVVYRPHSVTVTGKPLKGIDADMNAISDTAQTLAAVAVFAKGATRIRNVAHMRHKETDRIAAVATELRRMGITVDEHPDGLTIQPGPVRPATIQTYDDHRMAMSFALVGLVAPGIGIADPGCTYKTYPRYFDDLDRLCRPSR